MISYTCIYMIPHFPYPFTHQPTLRLLSCLGCCNNAAMNMKAQITLPHSIFVFSGYIPGSGISGSFGVYF